MMTIGRLGRRVARLFLRSDDRASSPRDNDVQLASFPRSGNTWMRVMLAQLLYGTAGDSIRDLQAFVPDVHVGYQETPRSDLAFRVVKTHHSLAARAGLTVTKAIYLIRDPRDVALSHYRYLSHLGYYDRVFDTFLFDWLNGRVWPCSWQEHVQSWTGEGSESACAERLIIRYEDLLIDPFDALQRIRTFLALERDDQALLHAINVSSVSSMRQRERNGMRDAEQAEGFQFIGSARAGEWKDRLAEWQSELIAEHAGRSMARFGYLDSLT